MTHDLKPRTKQHAIFWAWEDVIDGWDVVFHSMMQTNNKSYRVKVLGLDEQGKWVVPFLIIVELGWYIC